MMVAKYSEHFSIQVIKKLATQLRPQVTVEGRRSENGRKHI